MTPAMLALDEAGNLGVKTLVSIDDSPICEICWHSTGERLSKMEFGSQDLGQRVDIITVGQGFVRDGDSVIAVEQGAELSNVIAE